MLIRGLEDSDDDAIRAMFLTTVVLGDPLPFVLSRHDRYTDLCLGWYLSEGRGDAAVAIDDTGRVAGYALVCCDPAGYAAASSRSTLRFVGGTVSAAITGRLTRQSARFYTERARDSLGLWRGRRDAPMPAHAHVNVRHDARDGRIAAALCRHVDERVRRRGAPGWYGEVNAAEGRRAASLARLGLATVERRPNHTLTWILGRSIVRLTVVRRFPETDPVQSQPLRRNARNSPAISATITETTSG